MLVLSLNSGSSSIKYQLYDLPKGKKPLKKGIIERITNYDQAIKQLFKKLGNVDIKAIGHRVVHGGDVINKTSLINKKVIQVIKKFSDLAPLHNSSGLAGILACQKALPKVPQVAVFDTAFHATIPDYAFHYAIPYKYYQKYRVRKYGFHGTSHRYVALEAARKLKKKPNKANLITCHLGNGCSITAIKAGKSIDNSMGLTPLEGVAMGTRSGDIDPGIIFYLAHKERLKLSQLKDILNNKSGLLGLSGASNDVRDLLKLSRGGNKRAKLALEVFCYRIKKYIGAYLAVLGSVDAVVFTGGIGENSPGLIKKIMQGIKVKKLIIRTNEELFIARETHRTRKQC